MSEHEFILSAAYLAWGLLVHWLADWTGQNDWMANKKANLRHPAGYVHAGIHGLVLWLVFPWVAALALAVAHLLIDTRKPVAWWSKLIRQTQPGPPALWKPRGMGHDSELGPKVERPAAMLVDIGTYVRFETDQVFHYACIAAAAILVVV